MNSIAPIPTAVFVILALFACAQPAPPPQPIAIGPIPVATATAYCDAAKQDPFLNHVHFLGSSYNPVYPYNQNPTPDATPINSTTDGANIQQDLMDAFNVAPPTFRALLCSLDGIYINPVGCSGFDPSTCGLSGIDMLNNSWGFRTNTSPPQRYISISLELWKSGHAMLYSDYENGRLQALLTPPSKTYPKATANPNPPTFIQVSPNTSAMTVLAALVHEFGHVLWYDTFVVDENNKPNPGGGANTILFCQNRGPFYPSGSWIYNVTVPNNRWIAFGETLNGHPNNDVDISQLISDLGQGNFSHAGDLLHGIYSGVLPNGYSRPDNGPWASALAAFSPDEDFVETYQFYVLKTSTPPLANLEVQSTGKYGYKDDIAVTWRNKPELRRKMKCFGELPP
jgi:hypothetical protein